MVFVSLDRKSTRLNSSHGSTSYAVFCLKKKIQTLDTSPRRNPHHLPTCRRQLRARAPHCLPPPVVTDWCFFAVRFAVSFFFFFNDTATTEIYTLSLHDALPI